MGSGLLGLGISRRITEHITGGPPEKSYLGGSAEEQEKQRQKLIGVGDQSLAAGSEAYGQGVGAMGTAAGQTGADRQAALGYSANGQQLGQAGVGGQNAAVANARNAAWQPTDSLAQAQLQQQSDRNQRAMLAQASSARGGNQAAAIRNAQAVGSQMQLETNQVAAQMRAAEQQAAINRRIGVEQMAAGVGGQQAGLGYGVYGQGLGMAQNSTGQLAEIGSQQASAGLGQQNVGLGAYGILTDREKAILEADRANASATTASQSPAAAFGSIVGGVTSLWGGGGGKQGAGAK